MNHRQIAASAAALGLNDSVEWINERGFLAGSGYSPLSDYGTWRLTNGAATQSGRSLSIGACRT